jgi:hypothetical protein
MATIRYHVRPVAVVPAQAVLHDPPVMLAVTETLVPVLATARSRAAVDADVRRFALQRDAFVVVAPSASPGSETDAIVDSINANATTPDRRWRSEWLPKINNAAYLGRQETELRVPRGIAAMTRIGQSSPARWVTGDRTIARFVVI